MLFGPVLPVELITSSRRARYFVLRVVYATALLATLWAQYETGMKWRIQDAVTPSLLSQFASECFESFAFLQLLAVLLVTPALVGGTIAEEKDRRTLEYLFTTDLSNGEIVFGKLVSRLLHMLAFVSIGWPVLAFLLLLGGVSFESVLASIAIAVCSAFSVSGLAIWTSVQAANARDGVVRAFVIGFALLLLPPIATIFFGSMNVTGLEAMMEANPFVCLPAAITQTGTDWSVVVRMVRNQAVIAIPCCVVAWWNVRRAYFSRGSVLVGRLRGTRRWRPAIGDRPFVWKELFAERGAFSLGLFGSVAQWLIFAATIGPAVWLFATRAYSGWFDELRWYVVGVGTIVGCAGLMVLGARAAGSITAERERQSWDTLLSTPIDPVQIIHGKIAGAFYATRWFLAAVIILWILAAIRGSVWLVMLPIFLAQLMLLGLFTSLVGVLYSLRLRTSLRAMGATIGTLVLVGGGYLMCCMPLAGADDHLIYSICIPFLLALPPSIQWSDWNPSASDASQVSMILAYVAGLGFYSVATVWLYGMLRVHFDVYAGRICKAPRPKAMPFPKPDRV